MSASHNEVEERHRALLRGLHRDLLRQVGWYVGQDLGSAPSTARRAGESAWQLRRAGKLFAVRYQRKWCYPKFQFDSHRRPYPQMSAIIQALPDEQGWDRIQWFLEPHRKLQGRTPWEVWAFDREWVTVAAKIERWHERL